MTSEILDFSVDGSLRNATHNGPCCTLADIRGNNKVTQFTYHEFQLIIVKVNYDVKNCITLKFDKFFKGWFNTLIRNVMSELAIEPLIEDAETWELFNQHIHI